MSNNLPKYPSEELEQRARLRAQMQFLGQMASTETALFHQTAAAKLGLGVTDMKTVSTLLQEGSMTPGQIAKRLSLTTGAITNVIDRLESVDLVKRGPDSNDRRKVIIELNREKLESGENIYESMGQAFDSLLQSYSTQELEFLVRFYQASIEITRREIAKLADKDRS